MYIDKNKEQFIRDRLSGNFTNKQLAEIYNCSSGTIIRRAKKYKLINIITKVPKDSILTQSILKKILLYDKDTGIFTWKETRGPTAKKGNIAGTKSIGGYIQIKISGKSYLAHRLVFLYIEGELPLNDLYVDHIDHIRDNNKFINLRVITRLENNKNKTKYLNNTSGESGVLWNKRNNTWMVQIGYNNKYFNKSFKKKHKAIAVARAMYSFYGFHINHGKNINYKYISRQKRIKIATPINQSIKEKKEIIAFYKNKPKGYEIDHIHPISKGGKHVLDNLQYLTATENRRKGDKV